MFSFFRKKAPAEPGPAAPPAAPPAEAEKPADPPDGGRRKGPLGWLNADVGELFFGKKDKARPESAPPAAEPTAPQGGSTSPVGSTPLPTAASPGGDATAAAPMAAPAEPERVFEPAPTPKPVPTVPRASAPAPAPELEPEPELKPEAELELEPEPPPTEAAKAERASWVSKLKNGLRRTGSTIADAFVGAEIDDELYENLEAALLQADTGAPATRYLLDDLEKRVTRADVRDPAAARRLLARCVEDLLAPLEKPLFIGRYSPTVIMVVGVNGAGKTTSVGKLARHLIDADRKVLLAAADTFRAAAREQLLAWAERAGSVAAGAARTGGSIEIVSQQGGDPAGVTFDAVVAGKARGCDVVIADTAGRLATQAHLMEELKKIHRTIGKAQAGAPHEVLLVIDGNTGQNGLAQVQAFDAALRLTGLIITKLDGTAKGGVLAAIALWARERSEPLPVYFVGVGEKLADLQTFRAGEFADALVN
ncbi:MAG TPA: signal recognition particle-docking protein FtsY [Caldimonas sp.]|jgi:fused signal recognition particle receptor|nr:signal recognition particle-docking protein FtsY [Caldimonas sp.]HEX2540891.1 signal recognition particle-docking protein FtsY [Caldimonas sp.]